MITPSQPASVDVTFGILAVTQADRDAAGSLSVLREHGDMLRAGEYDDHPFVQAFARHRLASLADAPVQVGVNNWYADAPERIWLHGIGGPDETTWADDPMPGGEDIEREHAVGYVRDDRVSAAPSPVSRDKVAEAGRIADELDKLSSSHRPLLDVAAASLRALTIVQPAVAEGWRAIDSAPKDGEYLAGRWDGGDWIVAVLRSYATKPFTYWHILPAAPEPKL